MGRNKRGADRKFKRHEVHYGHGEPAHRGIAIQISATGAFIQAVKPIFAAGSRLVLEFRTRAGTWRTDAEVRHAKNLPPQLAQISRSGMGVQFLAPPPELVAFLESL